MYITDINTHVLKKFNIIISYHAGSSEPRVVSRYSQIVSAFLTVLSYIQVNNTTYQKVSAPPSGSALFFFAAQLKTESDSVFNCAAKK